MKRWGASGAVLLVSCWAGAANAVLVTSTSDDFAVVFEQGIDATTTVRAVLSVDVVGFTANSITLNVSAANTTTLGTAANAGLASYGFNVDPGLSFAFLGQTMPPDTATDSDRFLSLGLGENLPGIDNNIDLCVWAGNNCSGGAQGDLLAVGETDIHQLLLVFSGDISNGVDFGPFGAKFQTSKGSFEVLGCDRGDDCTSVPEPGSLAILGGALLGMGLVRRRRGAP